MDAVVIEVAPDAVVALGHEARPCATPVGSRVGLSHFVRRAPPNPLPFSSKRAKTSPVVRLPRCGMRQTSSESPHTSRSTSRAWYASRTQRFVPTGNPAREIVAGHSGLLETFRRTDVWPDSVQVPGGFALYWAAHPRGCGSLSVCSPPDAVTRCGSRRDCPARSSTARLADPIGTSTGGSST